MKNDIIIDESGTPEPQIWSGSVGELGEDLDSLRFHADRNVLSFEERAGRIVLRGKHRTGVLLLPSGRRLILRTKLRGIVLLDWLVYLGEFPSFQHWNQLGNVSPDGTWQQVLLKLFLLELDFVTRWHLRKDFVKLHIESPQVRGRLQAGSLANRIWRLPELPQVVRGRSFNTPANRMLSLALQQVLLFQNDLDADSRKLLYRLRNEWSEMTVGDVDRQQVVSDGLTSAPSGYQSALQLARLILFGASMDLQSGWGGQSFTLSLAGIWERSVRKMCKELAPLTGWGSLPASQCRRLWDDAIAETDPNRLMISDILLEREKERWVLDAKYKCGFGNEGRDDRFQMCAYAIGFNATRATLVYPEMHSDGLNQRTLLNVSLGANRVCIDSLALPMHLGPAAAKAALSIPLGPSLASLENRSFQRGMTISNE